MSLSLPGNGYGNTFVDEREKNRTKGICPYLSMFFRAVFAMQYNNPLVLRFTTNNNRRVTQDKTHPDTVTVDVNSQWTAYKNTINNAFKAGVFDYVMVTFDDSIQEASKNDLNGLNIKLNALYKDAQSANLNVYNKFQDNIYLLNPDYKDFFKMPAYMPTDDMVMDKYNQFEDKYAWQHHQAELLQKFSAFMPLGDGKYGSEDHHKILEDPGRGLEPDDYKDFFTWKSGVPIVPGMMGDDMVGMPGIKAGVVEDTQLTYHGKPVNGNILALKTEGVKGYVIPMRNIHGEFAKFQIGTDISKSNLTLKASTADGKTIAKSEFIDKKTNQFTFTMQDGSPANLKIESANNSEQVWSDVNGSFTTHVKEDIADTLRERGYNLPPIVDSLKVVPKSKYIWPNPGSMVGSNPKNKGVTVQDTVTPSNAGFITAREPKNGADDYVVVVTEGALKGVIATKYIDKPDANGISVADKIAGNSGIIVSQVPGVSGKFVQSVSAIYTDSDKKIRGTYIAMDADGRENLAVAKGIHGAYDELGKYSPVSVLSWDPKQKGLDDALLALSRHEITFEDMGIQFGSADKLFPLEQAEYKRPVDFNGNTPNPNQKQQDWQLDADAAHARRERKVAEAQQHTNAMLNGSNDIPTFSNMQQAQSTQQMQPVQQAQPVQQTRPVQEPVQQTQPVQQAQPVQQDQPVQEPVRKLISKDEYDQKIDEQMNEFFGTDLPFDFSKEETIDVANVMASHPSPEVTHVKEPEVGSNVKLSEAELDKLVQSALKALEHNPEFRQQVAETMSNSSGTMSM